MSALMMKVVEIHLSKNLVVFRGSDREMVVVRMNMA
jgi:hypothetical protein